jgi:hypothetical protein
MTAIGRFIDREHAQLTWALGTLTDALLLWQGTEENGFITYCAAAALSGNLIRWASSGVKAVKSEAAGLTFDRRVKPFAAGIHHSAGAALICSGLNLGDTGFSVAEIAFGVCSSSGSVMQFWGQDMIDKLHLRDTKAFQRWPLKHASSGRIALACYSPLVPSVFQDAWRLQSWKLLGVGIVSGCVLGLLWTRPDPDAAKLKLADALGKPTDPMSKQPSPI